MEPRIQYAQTTDGVSIAYWTLGEGEPMLMAPAFPSHAQLMWESPETRLYIELLARGRKLVGYDSRGWGLSERAVSEYSLEALVLDLEAVVRQSGLERFTLYCAASSGPVGIAYAADNAERLSNLILVSPWVGLAEWFQGTREQTVLSLLETDWELYTETIAHVVLGWEQGEPAHRFAKLMQESTTPEAASALAQAYNSIDVTDALPRIQTRTLVLHRRQAPLPPVESVMAVAARIPGAQLKLLEGTTSLPQLGDREAVARAIDEFLGEGNAAAAPSGLVTILFTDMEGSTALTQRMGDAKAQELVRAHNTIVREALAAHGGSEIKHTGDGIMASFTSASGALECAVQIQRAVAAHVEQHADSPLGVHIGLNAGEPVAEEADLFGTAVQLARRICDHAAAGQILVSNVVRELAAGKSFMFSDAGEVLPKGFDDPVRLYEVRWREEG
jgi:class 3 adenylate cyclase